MSPRKERYRTPEYIIKSFRNKSKNILYGPYVCPVCKKKKLKIKLEPIKKEVNAICSCSFQDSLIYLPNYEPVDYYSKMMDQRNKKS